MKIAIIGGVAGGASAAARTRRLDEKAEITIYEKGEYVSFANCGLPYHIGGVIPKRESLLVMTPRRFRERFNVNVETMTEVVAIDRKAKKIKVKNMASGETSEKEYDKLILSPGSLPFKPPIPGADDSDVMTLWTMPDMDRIKAVVDSGIKSAVVIGGGFIGVEVAENLAFRGIDVELVEMLPNILPQFDKEMATPLHREMERNGVKLHLDNGVTEIARTRHEGDTHEKGGMALKLKNGDSIETDLVIMAVGVRPNVQLAKDAGLDIGHTGAIKVDSHMRTNDPDVYAVGDAIEVENRAIGGEARIPLAGPANKQGRIAADNICGLDNEYKGSLGTSICKVFELSAASVGANERTLKDRGIEYLKTYLHPANHATYYPGADHLNVKVLFTKEGKILGAQIVGGDGADKRIDVLATAMRLDVDIRKLAELELSYAPPFGSAKDPVNFVGFVAENILSGKTTPVSPDEIPHDAFLLDIREKAEVEAGMIPNATHIPMGEIRNRLDELPKKREIIVYCKVGIRGYNVERILKANGFKARNMTGGISTWNLFFPPDEKNAETPIKAAKTAVPMENKKTEDGKLEELDASGMCCPGPIVAVKEKLAAMSPGATLRVKATDGGFPKDIAPWCTATGNDLLSMETKKGATTALIRKGAPLQVDARNPDPVSKSTTIVLFSNDLDKSMAAFIIATGFASLGHKVSIFFTFWGLNVLRKENPPSVSKDFLSAMFGMMMPRGAKKLALSKMHMMGMGTAMMKHVMNSKNVDSLPKLIEQAQQIGIDFIACEMAMNVMGITKEELIDGVEIAGVANFAALSEKSGTTLFV